MTDMAGTVILGGGVSGLACGLASGGVVLEARDFPGGICASYYLAPESDQPYRESSHRERTFRFERGGGHWIFGGDPVVLVFLQKLTPCRRYTRNSAVYFRQWDLFVPFPLQNHLHALPREARIRALDEIVARAHAVETPQTMAEFLENAFGPTLCELFFFPFHELYTAGLYRRIAPQDSYKTPVSLPAVLRGALGEPMPAGYNQTFLYPAPGLDSLVGKLAERCQIRYEALVTGIDLEERVVTLEQGAPVRFEKLVSTLPLSVTLSLAGLNTSTQADPATAVFVVNVGGIQGKNCPPYHWVYFPTSKTGFHRVGFYSNVERGFLPARGGDPLVSMYIERSFLPENLPPEKEQAKLAAAMVEEVVELGYLAEPLVVHWNTIPIAYTWKWPNSSWQKEAQELLLSNGIIPLGRFGRWNFQGIAESIGQGLMAGASLRR